jgi:glycosyltransferase involved in cell wall biosynthesis
VQVSGAGGEEPPLFSIVIPTFDRLEVLREVLAALGAQANPPPFEVVVVDDGSSDGTAEWLAGFQPPYPLTRLRQPNRGPAAARNAGVAAARGERVAFLGDDTVPDADWLAWHERAWRARGAAPELAVIGRTDWHPRLRRTPLLDYLNEQGLQFGFGLISDPEQVPFNFFYTSNLSLSRALLLAEPFDLRFPYAAWEDIEVAWRLTRHGLRIVYEARARVAHDHPTDLDRFARRQERAGYCAVVFRRLHPELGGFVGLGEGGPPPLPSRRVHRLRERLARALQFLPVSTPRLWESVFRFHYIEGLQRGWRELGAGREEEASDEDERTFLGLD